MSELLYNCQNPPGKGFVWLVGAGPGAVDLITLRGRNALAAADVVIHDDLAGQGLLRYCPANCEAIYVGKRAGHHGATQEGINRQLVAHARAGKTVVRLKGGDPSVFGRLGEELRALRDAGIRFEIVPGVTAACAAAAAAGVSLTQRGLASAAVLATGHECAGKSGSALDWDALAQPGATVCVYMGTRRLGALAARLMANGHAAATPLLIISHASLPSQNIRARTLETAAAPARTAVDSPSLIIIGAVAAQNRDLSAILQPANEPAYVA